MYNDTVILKNLIEPSSDFELFISNYTPNIELYFSNKYYEIKTVNTKCELMETLYLRKKVFEEEMCTNFTPVIEIDEFDKYSDIMIVRHLKTNKIVGTYRMLLEDSISKFYSETEFNIEGFLKAKGKKLELSRACIDQHHRNGGVISLLWRGILQYATIVNAKFLFGSSSMWNCDFTIAKAVFHNLQQNGMSSNMYNISPNACHRIPSFNSIEVADNSIKKSLIPSLLRVYLSAGALIHGDPAYDREFNCIDFLTVLNLQEIDINFKRKYKI